MRKAFVDRSYAHAMAVLDGRRRPQRPSAQTAKATNLADVLPSSANAADLRGVPSIVGMKDWLHQIGHDSAALDKLNVIHVAGTKGKGSTCAFIESILRSTGRATGSPSKTGLYTSPHLVWPEERIRLNFRPVTRELFARYFFEVWDALQSKEQRLPRYLQLMALTALHTFVREGVDAAIVECHHGGAYDATNVFDNPVVTVITPLGMDHVKQLGPTIQDIAWHKTGIFKKDCQAYSGDQPPETLSVFKDRSNELGVDVRFNREFIEHFPSLAAIKPPVQRHNCSLAIGVALQFLLRKHIGGEEILSSTIVDEALSDFSWPGRFQRVEDGRCTWLLDGAHNEMSIGIAADWFSEQSQISSSDETAQKIVIFGQVTNSRDSREVLRYFTERLRSANITQFILTSYDPNRDFNSSSTDSTNDCPPVDSEFIEICKQILPDETTVVTLPTVGAAMEHVRALSSTAGYVHVLATGSQHLVGEVLFNMNHSSIQSAWGL